MSREKSHAVLIHGLHMGAHGWEDIVWGNPPKGVWGIIPRGVEYAWRTQAELIVWGSGASERDGMKEAECFYARALEGIQELANIAGTTPEELQTFLEAHSEKDVEAQNTADEIQNTLEKCLARGIQELTLIPAASQAPIATRRVLGMVLEDERYAEFRHRVTVAPSDTRYEGTSMQDIVIFAPAHRGDRLANPSHILARKTLDVIQRFSKAKDAEGLKKFLEKWESLVTHLR